MQFVPKELFRVVPHSYFMKIWNWFSKMWNWISLVWNWISLVWNWISLMWNWISLMWNWISFVWNWISFVRNRPENGIDRNLAKANCTGNHVCTSCVIVVLGTYLCIYSKMKVQRKKICCTEQVKYLIQKLSTLF